MLTAESPAPRAGPGAQTVLLLIGYSALLAFSCHCSQRGKCTLGRYPFGGLRCRKLFGLDASSLKCRVASGPFSEWWPQLAGLGAEGQGLPIGQQLKSLKLSSGPALSRHFPSYPSTPTPASHGSLSLSLSSSLGC